MTPALLVGAMRTPNARTTLHTLLHVKVELQVNDLMPTTPAESVAPERTLSAREARTCV